MMFTQVRNKTLLCLLIVALFTSFFFARSVTVREPWIQPTLLMSTDFQYGTLDSLVVVNNWLAEGAFKLYFNLYFYPASVETPTLDKRYFYGSHPPGGYLPLYVLFKLLDFTGIVDNVHEKRGQQILLLILYNYLLHFFLVFMLGVMLFLVCRKISFDNLNSTIFALIPSVIHFHSANDLYWHHLVYYQAYPAVMLPFVLYILLEVLRITDTPSHVRKIVRILQPLVMFYGMLVQWFFAFVIVTVYGIRIMRKEIFLPVSLRQSVLWLKQSCLFFIPSMLAVAFWLHCIIYHISQAGDNFFDTPISSTETSIVEIFLSRTGYNSQALHHLQKSLVTHMVSAHGITGMAMLCLSLYIVIRKRKFLPDKQDGLMISLFIMLFMPCILYHLIFIEHAARHEFFSATFRPALVISFVLLPILVLQLIKKSCRMPAICVLNKRVITITTLLSLISSMLYAYTSVYGSFPITKRFSPPNYQHLIVGDFVRNNTSYNDVVFCQDHYTSGVTFLHDLTAAFFYNKLLHYAHNLDYVYHKTKAIEQDFTVRILYYEWRKREMQQLATFLDAHNIHVEDIQKEGVGGLITFDGQKFLSWYERREKAANKPAQHVCDKHPQRCSKKEI